MLWIVFNWFYYSWHFWKKSVDFIWSCWSVHTNDHGIHKIDDNVAIKFMVWFMTKSLNPFDPANLQLILIMSLKKMLIFKDHYQIKAEFHDNIYSKDCESFITSQFWSQSQMLEQSLEKDLTNYQISTGTHVKIVACLEWFDFHCVPFTIATNLGFSQNIGCNSHY